ncbi:hypothetical protein Tco_0190798 [Tanacetum coccineum]
MSKKQNCIAMSLAEAEYVVLSASCQVGFSNYEKAYYGQLSSMVSPLGSQKPTRCRFDVEKPVDQLITVSKIRSLMYLTSCRQDLVQAVCIVTYQASTTKQHPQRHFQSLILPYALIIGKSTSGEISSLVDKLVVRLGINPMIQPEPEDLPKDNPKLEIAVLRSNGGDGNLNPIQMGEIRGAEGNEAWYSTYSLRRDQLHGGAGAHLGWSSHHYRKPAGHKGFEWAVR